MISEMVEFFEKEFGSALPHVIKKSVYRGTDCGAWVEIGHDFVQVGSIVEGVEETTSVHRLSWPFTTDEFWAALQEVEDEADEIWKQTHGCEFCGEEDPDTGYVVINPDCPECGGFGTSI